MAYMDTVMGTWMQPWVQPWISYDEEPAGAQRGVVVLMGQGWRHLHGWLANILFLHAHSKVTRSVTGPWPSWAQGGSLSAGAEGTGGGTLCITSAVRTRSKLRASPGTRQPE